MTTKTKGLSIIIPTYNRIESVIDCLNSVLANVTKTQYEIILVDDNGNKQFSERLKKALPRSRRIKYHQNRRRRGPAYSRNKAIKKSRYSFLSFLDDDCLVPKDWITSIIAFFDKHKKPYVVGVRGKTETTSSSRFTQAHVMYENYWLQMLHTDFNGNKNIMSRFKKSFSHYYVTQAMIDFAPTTNLTIAQADYKAIFNTAYKDAAGEDVALCKAIREQKRYIAYTDTITVSHNHQFTDRHDFESKFKTYGKHLKTENSLLKRIANCIINPFLIVLYFRKPSFYSYFFLIEKNLNF
jgi:glycosyltransferase involved in cell wall biosynthesis